MEGSKERELLNRLLWCKPVPKLIKRCSTCKAHLFSDAVTIFRNKSSTLNDPLGTLYLQVLVRLRGGVSYHGTQTCTYIHPPR